MAMIPKLANNKKLRRKKVRKLGKIQDRIDSGSVGAGRIARVTAKRDKLRSKLGKNPVTMAGGPVDPTASNPAHRPLQENHPVAPGLTTERNYNEDIEKVMSGLFPKTGAFDPSNYINQEMYDWQLGKGTDALDKYNASRGLLKSGAEAENNRDFVQKLGAETTDRAMEYAQLDAGRAQQGADRLYGILRDEADRSERGEQNQYDNMLNTLRLQLEQSPLQAGITADQTIADILANKGAANFDVNSNNYARTPNAPSNYPAYQGPAPVLDTSASDYYGTINNTSSNNDYLNTILDLVDSFN